MQGSRPLVQNVSIMFSFCFISLRPSILGKRNNLYFSTYWQIIRVPVTRLFSWIKFTGWLWQHCNLICVKVGWRSWWHSHFLLWSPWTFQICICPPSPGLSRCVTLPCLFPPLSPENRTVTASWRSNFLSAAHRRRSFNYCWDAGGRQGLSEHDSGGGGWDLSFSLASIMALADNCRLASSAGLENLWQQKQEE